MLQFYKNISVSQHQLETINHQIATHLINSCKAEVKSNFRGGG